VAAQRVLVTGATGFVGRRLLARLARRPELELHALARGASRELEALAPAGGARVHAHACDLCERLSAIELVRRIEPQRVYHLAALAEPAACAADPLAAWRAQVSASANLLAALSGSGARMLLASSAQVYAAGQAQPLRESDRLAPASVYGRTKLAAERVAQSYARAGAWVAIARPFNHSGAGQSTAYVLPALTRSVLRAAREGTPLLVGNLHPRRDFLHVEDVLAGYERILESGAPGGIYNVATGRAHAIGALLELVQKRLSTSLTPVPDPERTRAGEADELRGDASRLLALGWAPSVSLEDLVDELASAALAEPGRAPR
jgi:GDP-4-dehydro-6-deoxy-D-mannose reductase